MIPSKLKKRIEKIQDKYNSEISQLANEVLYKKIIPFCNKNELSFFMINGIPRLVNKDDNYVPLPLFIKNLYEIHDKNGDNLMYFITEDYNPFKYDLNLADRKNFNGKYKDRTLSSLIFSPAFQLLK